MMETALWSLFAYAAGFYGGVAATRWYFVKRINEIIKEEGLE